MEDRLCASPEFRDRWFDQGFTAGPAARAPVVHYGRDDELQKRALFQCFGPGAPVPPAHFMPSAERIYEMVLAGCTFAMVPLVQGASDLRSGRLVELAPAGRVSVELYWHRWSLSTILMGKLEEGILRTAGQVLHAGGL